MADQDKLLTQLALTASNDNADGEQKQVELMSKSPAMDEEKYQLQKIKKRTINPTNKDKNKASVVLEYINDMNNSNWRTPGDRELRKITHFDGTEETLWFTPHKYHHKKLFISFRIDRVAVDHSSETFRMRFHIQFNWIPSEADYKAQYKAAKLAKELNQPDLLSNWTPKWCPRLKFDNVIEEHAYEWIPHPKIPEKGPFRMTQYKQFGGFSSRISAYYREYDFTRIKWICAELQCDMTFAEELELQSYPFDCQDLSSVMQIASKDTVNYTVFTFPNFFNADIATGTIGKIASDVSLIGMMDPSSSQLDEWDVENCIIEYEYSKTVLSIKLSRRWRPVLINTLLVIFLVSLLSFTVFAVPFEDTGSRLELTLTLILTAVLFDTKSSPKPYLTFMDKYILTSYTYLTIVMIENSMAVFFDSDIEDILFWVILVLFLSQHLVFFFYALYVSNKERKKLYMGYKAVKEYNKRYEIGRETLILNQDYVVESGGNNKYMKCLSISSNSL